MRTGLLRNSWLIVLLLWAHVAGAVTSVTHNFNSMTSPALVISDGNKVGTTDLCTYRCSGNATFGLANSVKVLSVSNGYGGTATVLVDKQLHNLKEIQISLPSGTHTDLKVYKSLDGEHWGEPLTGNYYATSIVLQFPQSDYYIKLENTKTNNTQQINAIRYFFGECECKAVVFD